MFILSIVAYSKSRDLIVNPLTKRVKRIERNNDMIMKYIKILPLIFELFAIISITLLFYLNKPIKSDKVILIPKGSISKIISYLHDKKDYRVGFLDKYILYLVGSPQSGWIDLKKRDLSRYDFWLSVTTSKAAMINITLIPGETRYMFFKIVSKKLDLNFNLLELYYKNVAPYSDGVILANTYKVPIGITEDRLIAILLGQSLKTHASYSKKFFGYYDEKKWFKFISIASVIQKESASIDEMSKVSAVIYNRLKKKMKLQMDGTLNYGKYSHKKVTPKMIREDRSRFNTYKHYGIPPSPVCAVSKDAIRASIFPDKVDYLYFMKNKTGKHTFTKSYKAHKRVINSVKK